MSREIKFRGWDKKLEKMFGVGGLVNMDHPDSYEYKYATNNRLSAGVGDGIHQWLDMELMQYTGLKDKNGVEIYEGDILAPTAEITANHAVEWSDGLTGFEPFNQYDIEYGWYYENENCEVIGNIYENPELLNDSEV